jgi:ketosteroid isomerase-like protein
MSQEDVEVVRRVFEASARRDSDAVLALYDPDVEWDAARFPTRAEALEAVGLRA